MTSKYDKILSDLLTRFSVDSDVDEQIRRIVKEVINAEVNKLSLRRPHKIKEEIKAIIEREAKALNKI